MEEENFDSNSSQYVVKIFYQFSVLSEFWMSRRVSLLIYPQTGTKNLLFQHFTCDRSGLRSLAEKGGESGWGGGISLAEKGGGSGLGGEVGRGDTPEIPSPCMHFGGFSYIDMR